MGAAHVSNLQKTMASRHHRQPHQLQLQVLPISQQRERWRIVPWHNFTNMTCHNVTTWIGTYMQLTFSLKGPTIFEEFGLEEELERWIGHSRTGSIIAFFSHFEIHGSWWKIGNRYRYIHEKHTRNILSSGTLNNFFSYQTVRFNYATRSPISMFQTKSSGCVQSSHTTFLLQWKDGRLREVHFWGLSWERQ